MAYEREELRRIDCLEEAELVTRVSDWDVAAGYDIKSFSGHSKTKRHDKFIEVKGSAGAQVRFFWSRNEIEKAKSLRKNYWLYFLPEVHGSRNANPLKIQDPIRRVLNSERFNKDCVGFEVTLRSERGA